uniref:Uncharacterized protein n=1 Tax=Caenorhabditis japonica TaxID=281687 RepID=A0A8R1IL81_CAEJA
MSCEDVNSIVPIKLAQRFIHVVDFNADAVTCYSASTGTVSYDSIASPKNGRPDFALLKGATQCMRQPPRPHNVSKICKVLNVGMVETPTPVDLDMFREVRKEQRRRRAEISSASMSLSSWNEVNHEVQETLKECFQHFQKSGTNTKVYSMNVEFPTKRKRNPEFLVTKKPFLVILG